MDAASTHPVDRQAGVPTVSVCMATHDGGRFVADQLASILAQLGPNDEVVIVDDDSSDDTLARLREVRDSRVRLVEWTRNRGYVRAFEEALRLAGGEMVLLADQDDVWVPGRVSTMVRALEHADVVASNLATLGGGDSIRGPYGQVDWRLRASQSRQHAFNVLGILAGNRPYYGCAMGVRRSALGRILPFPSFLSESHDLWIALYGNIARSIVHLDERTVWRRFHEDNITPDRPRGFRRVVRSRRLLLRSAAVLWRRVHV